MVDRQLSFMAACDIGDSLIAIDERGIGMFRIDKQDMSSHLIAELEDLGKWPNRYQAAELCNNEIFFFPAMTSRDKVIIYHLNNGSIENLDLNSISDDIVGDYEPLYRLKDCVWMFPRELTRELLRFDLHTRQIEIIPQWKKIVSEIELGYMDPWAKAGNLVEVQNVLYHTIRGTNLIVGIDKENYNVNCYSVPIDAKFYIRMNYDGEQFWIAECDNQGIVSWNPITQKTERYSIAFPKEEQKQYNWIDTIFCGRRYLWLIPWRDKTIIRLHYETGKYEYIDIFPQVFRVRKGNNKAFSIMQNKDGSVDLYPFFGNILIHIDLEKDILLENYEQLFLPSEWTESDVCNYQLCHEYEAERVSFDAYIDYLLQTAYQTSSKENDSTIGENVWRKISRSDI